jgi:hypothetical protein
MALKGTLKDFGIADILQLIGQQQKTGVLFLKAKEQEVAIGFKDGNIVKAESSTRKRKELIGNMLVRAELISDAQLESALDTQRRTLKRLGDVLVNSKFLTPERFKQMMQLQATETLYGLFSWKSGTYEFEQGEVDPEADAITPIRAESVLMEGFRMVDEWPVIKKVISRYDMTFDKLKDLPPPAAEPEPDFDASFEDAFAEKKKDENKGEFKSVGDSERKVAGLVKPGRDVRKLIDLSCLGEFETCKGLCNLVNLEYMRPIYPQGRKVAAGPGIGTSIVERVGGMVGRMLITALVLGVLALIASQAEFDTLSLARPSAYYADPAAQRFVSRAQISRIEAALDVYRLEKGELPEKLDALVETGLLGREDLHYPWRDPYYYRRTAAREFILLPPLR